MAEVSFAGLAREPYVSLATFRRNGKAVETPVWCAPHAERLYVFSEARAGKVKRLRNDPRVRVAACNVRGRVHGGWLEGRARIVDDASTQQNANAALLAKYGWQMRLANFFSRLSGRIDARAMLEIEFGAAGGLERA